MTSGRGTPPNGWRCQCYRNQLTESQAQDGLSTPPDNNILSANIPKEWRYDQGREMLAPNFTRYEALRKIKYKGKSVIAAIKDNYRKEMSGYQLTQAEWNIYYQQSPR